jgi:hypothetical protein
MFSLLSAPAKGAAVVVLLLGVGMLATADAQTSRCASCHFANIETAPAPNHLSDWDSSPHGRNSVGCEACHDGDSTTFESTLAHRDVLSRGNPASPVNRANIPATCGTCHAGPYTNFQQSQHFELLNDGNRRVPVCVTCHGDVGARLLSPTGLERTCDNCHGSDGVAPRPGRAADARLLVEGAAEVRESLEAARRLIENIRDPGRRAELEEVYTQAEVPLIQARQAGHRFVFDALEERLGVARERTAALLTQLVNPGQ